MCGRKGLWDLKEINRLKLRKKYFRAIKNKLCANCRRK